MRIKEGEIQNKDLRYRKLICVLSFVCSALLSTSNVRLQKAEAAGNSSIKFASLHQATTAATRGKYYGQIVFSSDRQNDNGIKLWTMNPDGSNQIQLTFESERSPNLPSYLPVYDVAPKWSPDGTKIAFHSNQDLDLENRSISWITRAARCSGLCFLISFAAQHSSLR